MSRKGRVVTIRASLARSEDYKEMASLKMTFRRDVDHGPACLEYSWVPEGKRRSIHLRPVETYGSQTDTVPDALNPSHVQVYALNNNRQASTPGWQYPIGPPHGTPIQSAVTEVFQSRGEAVGTTYYKDGKSANGTQKLSNQDRPCPEQTGDR